MKSYVKPAIYSALLTLVAACSSDNEEVNTDVVDKFNSFPNLPTSTEEKIVLEGSMEWWFWEGDGGCFSTITDGRKNVELHSEADLCVKVDYNEGQEAKIKITYDPNKQYSSDGKPMYSIVTFIQ